MIEIQELSFSYPGSKQPALTEVSLEVAAGEFVLLAGPSGAGKSTLLRCLNGLVPHFSGGTVGGSVRVFGHDVIAEGPQAMSHHVGFVFQNPEAQNVVDEVESEIAFGLENAAVAPEEMRARVEDSLEIMGLTALRGRSPWSLSGGERQKLAIASVLASRPKVLVLDEPTSQLDPTAARDLLETIVRLNQSLNLTVVLVEHRLERVVGFAARLLYLVEGQFALDGPMRETLAKMDSRQLPPLARLADRLAWQEMPLSVREGKTLAVGGTSHRQNGHRYQMNSVKDGDEPMADPIMEAKGLRFAYNGNEVLRGVDLTVRSGEALALMGPNGAGKSTLLKCLVGLLRPSSGQVRLMGQSTADQTVAQICRKVAYLPQAPDDLLFADTVLEELQTTLANHGQSGVGADRIAESLLIEMGLDTFKDQYPRDLSVGQRQRVALGAVSVVQPKLLLLDEPTRGLDYGAKRELMVLWRQWLDEGMGLILVSHDVELVTRIARRVVVMEAGRVRTDGPVEQVLSELTEFEPQMARLFPGRQWLTVDEVIKGIKDAETY